MMVEGEDLTNYPGPSCETVGWCLNIVFTENINDDDDEEGASPCSCVFPGTILHPRHIPSAARAPSRTACRAEAPIRNRIFEPPFIREQVGGAEATNEVGLAKNITRRYSPHATAEKVNVEAGSHAFTHPWWRLLTEILPLADFLIY